MSTACTESWKFFESLIVEIVCTKCNLREQLCPNNKRDETKGNNHLLLGYANPNDPIFEIEVDETLVSALD